jgi:flagellar hook-associated protein 3 FlgL
MSASLYTTFSANIAAQDAQINTLEQQIATGYAVQTPDSVNSTYSAVSTLYDNVQSIIEQSLNGATSPQELQTLSTQISSASQQLLGLANTTAPDGNFLFGGTRTNLTPFQTNSAGAIVYLGDAGQSNSQISSRMARCSRVPSRATATARSRPARRIPEPGPCCRRAW